MARFRNGTVFFQSKCHGSQTNKEHFKHCPKGKKKKKSENYIELKRRKIYVHDLIKVFFFTSVRCVLISRFRKRLYILFLAGQEKKNKTFDFTG